MTYAVLLTESAARDLAELHAFIGASDSPEKANYVLEQIESVFTSLSENPHRGAMPEELSTLGLRDYREVFFKPYRVIYRVGEKEVFVMLIADGRRDMQALLQQRLLRP